MKRCLQIGVGGRLGAADDYRGVLFEMKGLDMAGEEGHGAPVMRSRDVEDLLRPRVLRLALEVLGGGLNPGDGVEEKAAIKALGTLRQKLIRLELEAIGATGLVDQYLIIRPVDPLSLPDPDSMVRIRDAIITLIDLGMICGRADND